MKVFGRPVFLVEIVVEAETHIGRRGAERVACLCTLPTAVTYTKLCNRKVLVVEVDSGTDFHIGELGIHSFHGKADDIGTNRDAAKQGGFVLLLFLALVLGIRRGTEQSHQKQNQPSTSKERVRGESKQMYLQVSGRFIVHGRAYDGNGFDKFVCIAYTLDGVEKSRRTVRRFVMNLIGFRHPYRILEEVGFTLGVSALDAEYERVLCLPIAQG